MGHVITSQPIVCLQRPYFSINRWLIEKRNALLQKAEKKLSPLSFTLFASIFWGKKELNNYHMEPIKDQFKIWGILHYLARSGLHVLLFIILWNWIFSFLPFRFGIKQLLLGLIIVGYHLLSWPSISFIRSIISFVFYKICLFNDLQINILHLLALTCTLVLLVNPFQLFFLDFQLSFGLTFALAWLSLLQKYS
jgi:competence protein ComEC